MCAVASAPGRPASDNGRLCHGAGGPEGGGRCRRAFMLTILQIAVAASHGFAGRAPTSVSAFNTGHAPTMRT